MNIDEKENRDTAKLRREIAKLIQKHEPHIALSAMTMCMALVIVSNRTPFSDESIFDTANETLRDAVAEIKRNLATRTKVN
jgi:hypothetical protein